MTLVNLEVKYRASNATSDYYAVADPASKSPVTVVATGFGTLVCLTCRSNDRCIHTLSVKESEAYEARAKQNPEG